MLIKINIECLLVRFESKQKSSLKWPKRCTLFKQNDRLSVFASEREPRILISFLITGRRESKVLGNPGVFGFREPKGKPEANVLLPTGNPPDSSTNRPERLYWIKNERNNFDHSGKVNSLHLQSRLIDWMSFFLETQQQDFAIKNNSIAFGGGEEWYKAIFFIISLCAARTRRRVMKRNSRPLKIIVICVSSAHNPLIANHNKLFNITSWDGPRGASGISFCCSVYKVEKRCAYLFLPGQ